MSANPGVVLAKPKGSQSIVRGPVPDAAPLARVTRVVFADVPPKDERRRFSQPRPASITEDEVSLESAAAATDAADPADRLFVVAIPESSGSHARDGARALAAGRDRASAITLEQGAEVLEWRPGFAIVQGREDSRRDMTAAVVDFAFYEGSLRALETFVDEAEVQAQTDVRLAHRVRYRDRKQWERLAARSEECARMRLTYARLEPQLLYPSRTLSPAARSWMTRLLQKAEMESRLEALSERLEALEDLYEGGAQRISEYRWFVGGHALEIGIIVLLVIECATMGVDIYLRNHGGAASRGAGPTEVNAER